jgi:2-oxoglutarate dehydrogenase E2 component (dihydrolipoamide succinyltransferase)
MPEREEGERVRSSPLVRKIAAEHRLDLGQVPGTGLEGRITKSDILSFIEQQSAGGTAAAPAPARAAAPAGAPAPGEIVPLSTMRKKIAEHMLASRRTSAHVHCVYEVDMTRIVRLREKEKKNFEQRTGAKLTYMPFFARAVINGVRQFPVINASVEGENIHYKREINLGIAVALDWGLIVPVVKHAEERNFLGLQRAISDVGERARSKKLTPDDVAGSTFTITNPGQFGALFGLPIINQPNVAILGVGGIFKAPMVATDDAGQDSIAIRSIAHLVLGYDHRVIDGAVADQFMAQVKKYLENWNEDIY